MWFLWIFGDNVEERLGADPVRHLLPDRRHGGRAGAVFSLPDSTSPMIGASGAIAGVLGGYLMLYPRAQVVTFVGIPFLWHIRDVPAWIFLGIWFLGQFLLPTQFGRRLDGARRRLPGAAWARCGCSRGTRPRTPTAAPSRVLCRPPGVARDR